MKNTVKMLSLLALLSSFSYAGILCDYKADRLRDKIQHAQEKDNKEAVVKLNLSLKELLKHCDDKKIVEKQDKEVKELEEKIKKIEEKISKESKAEKKAKLEKELNKEKEELNQASEELVKIKAMLSEAK